MANRGGSPAEKPSTVGVVPSSSAALVLVAYVGLGVREAGLGLAWQPMRASFDLPLDALGLLLAAITIGYLTATATTGRVLPRWGIGAHLVVSASAVAAGLAAVAVAPQWWIVLVAAALVGLGLGLIDGGLNTHVAVGGHGRLLNLLHGSFGVGATLGPLAVVAVLGAGLSWRWGVGSLAAVTAAVGVGLFVVRHRWGPTGTAQPGVIHPRPRGRALVVIVLTAVTFACYTACEVSVGYLTIELLGGRGMEATTAARWIASFWAALTVGRLAMGAWGARWSPDLVVWIGGAVAAVGSFVLWLTPESVAPFGLAIIGLGLAGVFPALVAVTPRRVGVDVAPWAVGIELAAAAGGAAAGPGLLAVVVDGRGAAVVAPALLGAVAMFVIVHTAAVWVARIGGAPHPGAAETEVAAWPSVVAQEP